MYKFLRFLPDFVNTRAEPLRDQNPGYATVCNKLPAGSDATPAYREGGIVAVDDLIRSVTQIRSKPLEYDTA